MLSNPYAKKESLEHNPLNRLLYGLAYPLAVGFARLRVTPDQITGLSCVMSIIAGYSIANGAAAVYAFTWTLALLLDYCDGTVARMTNSASQTAFRFDHTSDLVKVSGVLICAAVGYGTTSLWVVASVAALSFLLYNGLNLELKFARERHRAALSGELSSPVKAQATGWLRTLRTTLLTVNGHTLLVFLLLAIDARWALSVCLYFAAICTLGALQRILLLRQIPKA